MQDLQRPGARMKATEQEQAAARILLELKAVPPEDRIDVMAMVCAAFIRCPSLDAADMQPGPLVYTGRQ